MRSEAIPPDSQLVMAYKPVATGKDHTSTSQNVHLGDAMQMLG